MQLIVLGIELKKKDLRSMYIKKQKNMKKSQTPADEFKNEFEKSFDMDENDK
jgi:hypothetical protein